MIKHGAITAGLIIFAASNVALAQSGTVPPGASQQHQMQQNVHGSAAEFQELQRSAQRLRQAIQAMAQMAPDPQREQAIRYAHEALFDANQAMLRLPVEYRGSAFTWSPSQNAQTRAPSGQSAEQALQHLQKASDRLYNAVHAMARETAKAPRAQAIKDANEALIETHTAMAWVYDRQLAQGSTLRGAQGAGSGPAGAKAAQGTASSRPGGGAVGGSGAESTSGHPSAVAGGVGINARVKLSEQALPEHNVKMVFALDTGNYVADVKVTVKDQTGRSVIEGVANGPWLYARLPAGTYTANATFNGQTVTEHFKVGRTGQRTAIFRWPASAVQATSGVTPILGTGPQNASSATAR